MELKDYPKNAQKHNFDDVYCQEFEKAVTMLEKASPEFCRECEQAMNEKFYVFEAGFELNDMTRLILKNNREQEETMSALQAVTFELETLRYDFSETGNDDANLKILLEVYVDHKRKMTAEKQKGKGKKEPQFQVEFHIVNYLAHLITERTLYMNGYEKNFGNSD